MSLALLTILAVGVVLSVASWLDSKSHLHHE